MPKVVVSTPIQFAVVEPGESLVVTGDAYGSGMPEPMSIAEVSVGFDQGEPVDAHLTNLPGHHPVMTQVAFGAVLPVAAAALPGTPHVITVRAVDDSSVVVTNVVHVEISGGPT
jgi:hypothetical protein